MTLGWVIAGLGLVGVVILLVTMRRLAEQVRHNQRTIAALMLLEPNITDENPR